MIEKKIFVDVHEDQKIECLICHKYFEALSGHLLRKHSINTRDYMKQFNVNITVSKILSKKLSEINIRWQKPLGRSIKIKRCRLCDKEFKDYYKKKFCSYSCAYKMSKEWRRRGKQKIPKIDYLQLKERLINKIQNVVKENKNIYRNELEEILCREFNCSLRGILRIASGNINGGGGFKTLLDKLNVNIKNVPKWKQKEQLGLEIAKKLYGEGQIKPYYKNIGFPDYVPNNPNLPIIDIKSTLDTISIEQEKKYKNIRKDVKFLVFDEKVKSEVDVKNIIYMKQIIKSFSSDTRNYFLNKYTQISSSNFSLQKFSKRDIDE